MLILEVTCIDIMSVLLTTPFPSVLILVHQDGLGWYTKRLRVSNIKPESQNVCYLF